MFQFFKDLYTTVLEKNTTQLIKGHLLIKNPERRLSQRRMKLRKQVTVFGGAIFCVAVFSLYLMLDRVQHDPARRQNGGNFPRVRIIALPGRSDTDTFSLVFYFLFCIVCCYVLGAASTQTLPLALSGLVVFFNITEHSQLWFFYLYFSDPTWVSHFAKWTSFKF